MPVFVYKNKELNEIIGYQTNFNGVCIEITEEEWKQSEYGKYADIVDNEFIILEKPKPTYSDSYPPIEEQLDMLFHDMNAGLFGDNIKDGNFFSSLKEVKDKFPKLSKLTKN